MVMALTIFVFLEIDPFFVIDLFFPTVLQRLAHSVLEDLFFGFLVLLSVAVTESSTESLPKRGFFVRPVLQWGIVLAVVWMAVTEKLRNFDFGPQLVPLDLPVEFEWKTAAAVGFLAAWIARALFLGARAEEGHRQRLLSYSPVVLFVWVGEVALRVCRRRFEEYSAVRVLPLALHVAFLFLVDHLHTELPSLSYRALDAGP
jgi:hypothetical protein